jgi:hypothetical protein
MTPCEAVLWLESVATGRRFPVAQFSADTDMVTTGWVSLTSINGNEIVAAMMTPDEWAATAQETAAYARVERRINAALRRDDLRVPWLVQLVDQNRDLVGLSFQDFSRAYRPPRILYRDILAPSAIAEVVAEQSLEDFEREGGKLIAYEA